MKRFTCILVVAAAGCAGGSRAPTELPDFALPRPDDMTATPRDFAVAGGDKDGGPDLAGTPQQAKVVINEVEPNGADPATMPDWVELKNVGNAVADVSGYKVRDDKVSDLTTIPNGTTIPAGGYLLILCDDMPAGTGHEGVHVPYKLSGGSGDEFHVVDRDGNEIDATVWAANAVPNGQTWARLPDGTGDFKVAVPTRGAANK